MRRPNALRMVLGATLTLSALVAACNLGDRSFSSGGGFGGSGGGTPSSSGTSGTSSEIEICDTATEGEFCRSSSQKCEFGAHASAACNVTLRCSQSEWTKTSSEPPPGCSLPCPAAYVADLPDGCAAPNARDLLCEYPEGTCGCAPVKPLTPDGGDDAGDPDAGEVDAGADAAKPVTTYVWTCTQPDAGCPRTRPRGGTRCVRPIECDYGNCLFADGHNMKCSTSLGWFEKDGVSCDR